MINFLLICCFVAVSREELLGLVNDPEPIDQVQSQIRKYFRVMECEEQNEGSESDDEALFDIKDSGDEKGVGLTAGFRKDMLTPYYAAFGAKYKCALCRQVEGTEETIQSHVVKEVLRSFGASAGLPERGWDDNVASTSESYLSTMYSPLRSTKRKLLSSGSADEAARPRRKRRVKTS